MARAARERHLQVFSTDPEEEATLDDLGATGRVALEGNPLFVVWQDATASRTGFFARKRLTHHVHLQADGSAIVESDVTLENRAPQGPPSILLGDPRNGDPVGYYAAYVNVYLPVDAEDVEAKADGSPEFDLVEEEFGHPVLMGLLGAGPGRSATLHVTYRIPRAVLPSADGLSYRADVIPQPALRPDEVRVDVSLPPGAVVMGSSGFSPFGSGLDYQGAPTAPQPLSLVYGPVG
jgi:hypothetical protein